MKACFEDVLSYPLVSVLQECISQIFYDICIYSEANPEHDKHVFKEPNQNRCSAFTLSQYHS